MQSHYKEKIAILLPSLEVGGIEVFWLYFMRKTKLLDVTLVILSTRVDSELLLPGDQIQISSNTLKPNNFFVTYCLKGLNLSSFDHIHCVDRFTLAHAHLTNTCSKITMGIYHSREMLWKGQGFYSSFQDSVFRKLFPNNIYFGNHVVKDMYQSQFTAAVKKHCVFPLGVELFDKKDHQTPFFHIAIIGRHTNFKTYITTFLNRWSSQNFGYHQELKVTVVGEGPLTENLKNQFPQANFVGSVSRTQLQLLLKKVDFVLCGGTTAPLVASTGTPVLIGIENEDEPISNGFIHEISHNAINLKQDKGNTVHFDTAVRRYYEQMQFDPYVTQRTASSVSDYDINQTLIKFETFISSALSLRHTPTRISKLRYRMSLLYWLVIEITCKRYIIRSRYN